MLTNELLKKVVAVLDSDYSSYAIAKFIGDASANNINNLRSGKSRIEDIKFGKLEKLEQFYEEEMKMKYTITVIDKKSTDQDPTILEKGAYTQEKAIEIAEELARKHEGEEDKYSIFIHYLHPDSPCYINPLTGANPTGESWL